MGSLLNIHKIILLNTLHVSEACLIISQHDMQITICWDAFSNFSSSDSDKLWQDKAGVPWALKLSLRHTIPNVSHHTRDVNSIYRTMIHVDK